MNAFDLALFTAKTFLLSHLVLFAIVIGGAVLVLSIVFLGTGPAVLAFLRSRVGQIIIALVVAATIGWEIRAYIDDSVALQRQLVTERQEAAKTLAAEQQRTAAEKAQADEARRQAVAQQAVATAAAEREGDADTYAEDLEDQNDDLNADLADATKHTPADLDCHRMSAADVGSLLRIGSPAGGQHAAAGSAHKPR